MTFTHSAVNGKLAQGSTATLFHFFGQFPNLSGPKRIETEKSVAGRQYTETQDIHLNLNLGLAMRTVTLCTMQYSGHT